MAGCLDAPAACPGESARADALDLIGRNAQGAVANTGTEPRQLPHPCLEMAHLVRLTSLVGTGLC
jgi:hypothetical protein